MTKNKAAELKDPRPRPVPTSGAGLLYYLALHPSRPPTCPPKFLTKEEALAKAEALSPLPNVSANPPRGCDDYQN